RGRLQGPASLAPRVDPEARHRRGRSTRCAPGPGPGPRCGPPARLPAGARRATSLAARSGPGRRRPIFGGRRFPDEGADLGRKALPQLLQQPVLGLLVLLAGRLDLAVLEQQTDETLMALFIQRISRHG